MNNYIILICFDIVLKNVQFVTVGTHCVTVKTFKSWICKQM